MNMRSSVMTTLVYGLVCAVLYMPLGAVFHGLVPGWTAWQLHMLLYLAGYAVILWRLGEGRFLSVAMPWLFVFCVAGVGFRHAGFLLLCLACLAWIRSGACFTRPWYRILPAELTTSLASGVFLAWFDPGNGLAMSICIWIFFLIQSLYFVIALKPAPGTARVVAEDSFDTARRRAERILGNSA